MSTLHYRIGADYIGGWAEENHIPPLDGILCPAPGAADDVWDGSTWIAKVFTSAELEALVQEDIKNKLGVNASDIDKAQFRVDADIWRAINPTLSIQQARDAVKARYEVHLREIRGI